MNTSGSRTIKNCCTPKTERRTLSAVSASFVNHSKTTLELSDIPGGLALTGTNREFIPIDEEGPCREQEILPFKMMQTTVTNAMFKDFVDETGYKTDAQRYGWSFVFYHLLPDSKSCPDAVSGSEWWRKVEGACWNRIAGSAIDAQVLDDHPVVHVSWNDAKAFADWAGGRLPTETEWEHAARGGLKDAMFPWGNQEPNDDTFQPCNIWQGEFPEKNTCTDGYSATAPAKSFKPNQYGLYNMCGNVWEWTSGRFKLTGRSSESKHYAKQFKGTKILKGGSYLCHKSYCFRYRIASRTGSTPDSTTSHQGFRLVFS